MHGINGIHRWTRARVQRPRNKGVRALCGCGVGVVSRLQGPYLFRCAALSFSEWLTRVPVLTCISRPSLGSNTERGLPIAPVSGSTSSTTIVAFQ